MRPINSLLIHTKRSGASERQRLFNAVKCKHGHARRTSFAAARSNSQVYYCRLLGTSCEMHSTPTTTKLTTTEMCRAFEPSEASSIAKWTRDKGGTASTAPGFGAAVIAESGLIRRISQSAPTWQAWIVDYNPVVNWPICKWQSMADNSARRTSSQPILSQGPPFYVL